MSNRKQNSAFNMFIFLLLVLYIYMYIRHCHELGLSKNFYVVFITFNFIDNKSKVFILLNYFLNSKREIQICLILFINVKSH